MFVPIVLLLACLAAGAASVYFGAGESNAPLLLSAVSALAALFLVLRAIPRRRRRWIVVDGSNVLHWQEGLPTLAAVGWVVDDLKARGLTPVVWFDANVGYKVRDRYLGPGPLAAALGLPERQVFVAPKGTPADPLLLDGAARLKARIVTNDRFRDWEEDHPRIIEPGFLVRGGVRDGKVRLDLTE